MPAIDRFPLIRTWRSRVEDGDVELVGTVAQLGHFGGSGTFVWIDPDAGLALVALTDRTFGAWAIEAWPRFADAVLSAAR